MADKRKLPVITAIIYTDDTGKQSVLGAAVDEPEVSGIARASSATITSGDAALSLYEPVVPRCKTCKHFTKDWDEDTGHHWFYCPHIEHDDLPPQDGSGYCWLHPEAKR